MNDAVARRGSLDNLESLSSSLDFSEFIPAALHARDGTVLLTSHVYGTEQEKIELARKIASVAMLEAVEAASSVAATIEKALPEQGGHPVEIETVSKSALALLNAALLGLHAMRIAVDPLSRP